MIESFNPPDSNFIAELVLLIVLIKSVRCSRFMQIAVVSMEPCDSCHPNAQYFYIQLRMSARMTGTMVRITKNKSFLCKESRVAGLVVEARHHQ